MDSERTDRMNWKKLLCVGPGMYADDSEENEFLNDYRKIITSEAFRRLQDKTQVFPLAQGDYVRTRLTHSLEVASVAKILGQKVFDKLLKKKAEEPGNDLFSEIDEKVRDDACTILECAGLLHDIGNPPFGHFGEESIGNWFTDNWDKPLYKNESLSSIFPDPDSPNLPEWAENPYAKTMLDSIKNDLTDFEGNAQSLRLTSILPFFQGESNTDTSYADELYNMFKNGFNPKTNLTYALRNTLIKYPVSSTQTKKKGEEGYEDIKTHKWGYFAAEYELYKMICENSEGTGVFDDRYPLTYLLEAADDISYLTADLEDALTKNVISYDDFWNHMKKESFEDFYDCPTRIIHERLHRINSDVTDSPAVNNDTDRVIKDRELRTKIQNELQKCRVYNALYNKKQQLRNFLSFIRQLLMEQAVEVFVSNYEKIMWGTFNRELLSESKMGPWIEKLRDFEKKNIYDWKEKTLTEISAGSIISSLLDNFIPMAVKYDRKDTDLTSREKKLRSLISDDFWESYTNNKEICDDDESIMREKNIVFNSEEEKAKRLSDHKVYAECFNTYLRILAVTDFISGMTDTYAKEVYRKINGMD